MFTDERRQVILAVLAVHGSASVADLARTVRTSEVTVRRDLRVLEDAELLTRHRGGASAVRAAIDEPTYLEKRTIAQTEKEDIARAAVEFIEDGDAIFVGAGTTTQALARLLTSRRLMVATTSLLVAHSLAHAPDTEVYVVGGMLRGNIRGVVGGDAEASLRRLRVRTSFISGNGLTAKQGLSTPNIHVASLDRAAMAAAERVVVLADHTKVGVDSTVQTAPAAEIDVLVTDRRSPEGEVSLLREQGLDVRIAASTVPALPDRARRAR